MDDKKTVDEKLEDAFNLPKSVGEIVEQEPIVLTPVEKTDVATTDFEAVRSNLYSIIEKGNKAINGILHVASEGDSPRAYEVVSQLIKSVADANKDLLQLHKQLKEIKNDTPASTQSAQNITNQSIFVGSTNELQKLLKGKMQELKQIESDS
jgi:seryl-tRNA synthetase